MRRKRSLGSVHVVLLYMFDSQALPLIASVPPVGGSTQVFSSVSVVLTATAAFSTFSPTQPLALIMNKTIVDNPGLSSFQPSDSGTPTTSGTSSITSISTNPDVTAQLPLAGPMIAGILVCIVVIAAMVVICFLQRRSKRPHRRRHSFETQFILQPDSHPHRHSTSRFLRDEDTLENHPRKKKYRRYSRRSRYSSGTMELEVLKFLPQDGSRYEAREIPLPSGSRQWQSSNPTISTFSLTLNTNKIANMPIHHVVDDSQTSVTLVPPTVSFNQIEQYSPRPTVDLPLQPLSSSSQNDPIHAPNSINRTLLPEIERHRLNTLIQQRAALLASGNTSDKSVYGELLLLEEQIQLLRRQDESLPQHDIPPPYEDER